MDLGILISLVVGILLGVLVFYIFSKKKFNDFEIEKTKINDELKRQIELVKKEAEIQVKDSSLQLKIAVEKEMKSKKDELANIERRLNQKEETIEKRSILLDSRDLELTKKEKNLSNVEKEVTEKKQQLESALSEQLKKLEAISGFTAEEAKAELIKLIENEAKIESAKKLRDIDEELKESANKKAQDYIATAIQKISGDFVAEKTVSSIPLPNDEMKGRIIGREGRNIRAFENATGVDIIIDDTPETVVISSLNPVRREVARQSIEKLIQDGRIHPARIEEIVEKTKAEVEQIIKETGEKTLFDLGIHNVHQDISKLIGTLKFRTSYGQNALQHSIEVAYICGILAGELNVSVKQARRAGIFHDLGKAVDHEIEGSHAVIGADILKKYNENPKIINAVMSHHGDEAPNSVIAMLVQAADALSAARPGARRETIETYIKRVEELEKIANGFNGVHKSYAIQAGREVRVIVENNKVSDDEAYILARDIAKKVEGELTYPGQIRVTVVRETRAVEYAK